jgi:hypothetical protein
VLATPGETALGEPRPAACPQPRRRRFTADASLGRVHLELLASGRDWRRFSTGRSHASGNVLKQKYEDGDGRSAFEWDMTIHGPIVALTITF